MNDLILKTYMFLSIGGMLFVLLYARFLQAKAQDSLRTRRLQLEDLQVKNSELYAFPWRHWSELSFETFQRSDQRRVLLGELAPLCGLFFTTFGICLYSYLGTDNLLSAATASMLSTAIGAATTITVNWSSDFNKTTFENDNETYRRRYRFLRHKEA